MYERERIIHYYCRCHVGWVIRYLNHCNRFIIRRRVPVTKNWMTNRLQDAIPPPVGVVCPQVMLIMQKRAEV